MYGKIINEELIYAPVNYTTTDNELICNFNTNEDLMKQHGFKKINGIQPNYDEDRECIIVKSFEENVDEIKVEWEVKPIGALLSNNNLTKDELINIMHKELVSSKENLVKGQEFDSLNSLFTYMFKHFSEEEIYIGSDMPTNPIYKLWIRVTEDIKDDDDDDIEVPTNPIPDTPQTPEEPEEPKTVFVSDLTLDATILGYYANAEYVSDKYPDKNVCLTNNQMYVGQYVKVSGTGKDIDSKIFKVSGLITNSELGLSSSHSLPAFAINCKDQETATAIGENKGKVEVGLLLSESTKVGKVICNYLNVRSGIGTKYDVIGTVANGYTFPILESYTNTSWVKVSYNNSIGYINANTEYVEISTIQVDSNGNGITGGSTETGGFITPCYGIDVSKHQGTVDFKQLKELGGIKFAILRIGYGNRSGSEPVLDPKFEEYLRACTSNNIPVGVYFFSYADSMDKLKNEANWVVNQLARYPQTFEFPIFFDQEYDSLNTVYNNGSYTASNPGKTVLTNYMNTFCQIINDAGYMAGIYTNEGWSNEYVNFNDIKFKEHIWVAQWSDNLTWTKTDVKLWQMGVKRLNGYSGDLDYDKCFFDYPSYVRVNHKNGF